MDNDVLIKIGADTSDLADGLKYVEAALQSLQDPLQSTFALLAGPEAAQAVQTFMELANKVAEFTERMSEMGRQTERTEAILGMSAEDVGRLGFVMQATGGDINDLGLVMGRLSFNLERAQRGAGPVADAVHALGLNTQQLIAMPAAERLNAIADAFSRAAPGAGTMQAAIELLGRTGIQMLPVFMQGSERIKELGDIADRAGAVINDQLAAAFENTLLKAKETNDAVKDGISITLFSAFEPAINAAADAMTGLIEDFNNALKSSGSFHDILQSLAFTAKLLVDILAFTIMVLQKLWSTLNAAVAIINKLSHGELPDMKKIWQDLNDEWQHSDDRLKKVVDDLDGVTEAAKNIPKSIIDPNAIGEAEKQMQQAIALENELDTIHRQKMEEQASSDLALGRSTIQQEFAAKRSATEAYFQETIDAKQREIQAEIDADKQGTQQYQKLLDERAKLYDEHDLALLKLTDEQAKAELEQHRTLTDQIIAEKEREAKTALQIATDNANREYELGQIGLAKREALIEQAANVEYETQRRLIEQKMALDAGFTTRYAADQQELNALDSAHAAQMVKVYDEAITAVEAKYRDYFSEVESLSNTLLSDTLHGVKSWRDEWRKLLQDVVLFFAQMVEKMIVKWVAGQIAMSSVSATETQTRAAQEVAADAETLPLRAANFASTITADAATVFAGIFANLAPFLGPAAAGPAAAGQATVLGQLAAAPKFETGSWSVPNTGPAIVHQGEMIFPKDVAEAVRSGSFGGDVHLHVHAVDATSVRQFFENNGEHIAHVMKQQARNFHPAFHT